jgi:ABC-type branched-subunit amino acid transport system ATPase component/ribose/xylose/arabinose/galactoside ABC-type transport system permease subunit
MTAHQRRKSVPPKVWVGVALVALALALLPFVAALAGQAWVRILNFAMIYIMLALGLNIVVGFAGLLDLGYIAFYAVGAYMYALLASPHFNAHLPFWAILPLGAGLACIFGVLLGAPTLKLRGDYLAIVTLGFGEIVRIFLNNLNAPVNVTNGPQGVNLIDPFRVGDFSFARAESMFGIPFSGPQKYYYVLLLLTIGVIVINIRLQNSRLGRAWEAIREDEVAAKAMGINTRNVKLLGSRRGDFFRDPAVRESRELRLVRVDHRAIDGRARGHGQHPRRDPRRNSADAAARGPALHHGTAAERLVRARAARCGNGPAARLRHRAGRDHAVSTGRAVAVRGAQARARDSQGRRRMSQLTLLTAKDIAKRFGGVQALADVSFTINHGEIYGLIGPNGAGKTSLFNVLTGIYTPDGGTFNFDGEPLERVKPNEVAERGIARTFQNIRLFQNLSALENVMIGRHVRTRAGVFGAILRDKGTLAEEAAIEKRSYELLEYVGVAKRANDLAKHLAYGDQRRLEIARALATEPKLLALDEPAAGMNATETQALKRLLEDIRRDGITILLIEHDMKLVMSVCDRVLVLDYGKKIAEGTAAAVQNDPKVIAAYLGGEVTLNLKGA